MNLNKHFGECLKKYIKDKGLKANVIASKIGISTSGFSDYYKAEYPRPETQQKILNALNITLEELYAQTNELAEPMEEYRVSEPMIQIPQSELIYLLAQSRELSKIKEKELAEAESKIMQGESPIYKTSALDK